MRKHFNWFVCGWVGAFALVAVSDGHFITAAIDLIGAALNALLGCLPLQEQRNGDPNG